MYELIDGVEACKTVYGMTKEADLTVKAVKAAGIITIDVETTKNYIVRLVNVKAAAVEGADFTIDGNDTVLAPKAAHMVVTL